MIECKFEDGNVAEPGLRHVVVAVVLVKDDTVLLVKRAARLLEGGKWAVPGGFMDRDETTTGTAIREVLEETGWKIKNLALLRINDNPDRRGEDRQNVEFLYFADATEKTGEADSESDERRWFGWDELPPPGEIAFDHADSLDLYQRHRKERLSLPIIG